MQSYQRPQKLLGVVSQFTHAIYNFQTKVFECTYYEHSNSLNADKALGSYIGSSLVLFQTQWAICPYGFEFWAEPWITILCTLR